MNSSNHSFNTLTKILFVLFIFFIIIDFNQVSIFLKNEFKQYFTYSICDKPVIYTVGSIDPKFNLSAPTFIAETKQAAQIWNKVEDKNLLIYGSSQSATLTINLVFDNRTELNNQINSLEGQVKQNDQSLQLQINSYKQQEADFKKQLASYNSEIDNLNQQIEFWNRRGGAPENIYQQLIDQQNNLKSEQSTLQTQANNLNQTAKKLNLSTESYNINVNNLNNKISTFDAALTQKPEEGLFDPNNNTISIYFDNNKNELIHTLAHEMGHALTLEHNSNPKSIMYPYSIENNIPTTDDINSLNIVCSKRYLNIPFLGLYSLNT